MEKNYFILKNNYYLLLLLISCFSFGQISQKFDDSGSFTFTVPVGVTSIKVEAWGSGAGGNNSISRGGGGGAFAGNNSIPVIPGTNYTVNVGKGADPGTGDNGQDSSFGNLVIARGAIGPNGGLATSSVGAITYKGGNGGLSSGSRGAGGGASAGTTNDGANGGNSNNSTTGAGGVGINSGGSGGSGGNNGSGVIGNAPGGGGGERGSSGSSGGGGNGLVIVTYTPAYQAQIISATYGSSTWCAGETRTVSVTIKNTGTQAWTDGGGKDFNIGVKWNTNGTSWTDYNVRVDAKNLAPGATTTYDLTITASNNTGAYTTPLAAGTNNLAFDVAYEGVAWFRNNDTAVGVGPGNVDFKTPNITISALPTISSHPSTTNQNLCLNAAPTALSVSAAAGSGNIQKYEWYSNTTASNTGGTLVRTNSVATSPNTYTPLTTATGTLYYYAVVTNSNGCSVTSNVSGAVTVNQGPTASNAGPDQSAANATSFTLAANTPVVGETRVWTIVSGPSTLLSQFSNTANPTATFTPAIAGTYVLNWAISNGCGTSSDQVVITNKCETNLLTNGDFSNNGTGWTFAGISGSDRVEVNTENTYFSNSNNSLTAELDSEATLRQVVNVIPGVSYTVSFRYARRSTDGTPATTGVTVRVTGGAPTVSTGFTTTNTISQIGFFTFTPTTNSVGIEFYNHLSGGITLGTIIDDIVLLPTSQANPYAVTNPRGVFNTSTSCAGVPVQLDVENVSTPGLTYTYLWAGSPGAVFSSTTIKNPTITFAGSGLQQATVTVTTGGCAVTSTTYVNVTAAPTITAPGASAVCSGGTYSSGPIASTGTSFDWSRAGVNGINGGQANAGAANIAKATGFSEVLTNSTANPINVTYVLIPKPATNGCAGIPYNLVVTVNPKPAITNTSLTQTICSGASSSAVTLTSGVAGTTFAWTATATTGVTGFTTSGTGTIPVQAISTTASTQGTVTYVITPTANGCPGISVNYTILVDPRPTVTNSTLTQTICSGAGSSAVSFTSGVTGTTYSWTASATTGVTGFTASGSGNLPVQTISTTGSSRGTVTYVIIPIANGCPGTSVNYTILVDPRPTVTNTQLTQTICSGGNSALVTLTSGVSGTTFAWTATATTGVTGFTTSGTGTIPVQAISTTASTQGTVTYVITPTANGCPGTSVNYTILVDPRPTVTNSTLTQTICSGAGSSAVSFTSGVTGTTYSWTASATTGVTGFTASGSGNLPVQTISTTGSSRGTVTYVITPIANGCPGTSVNYTILVDPRPTVTNATLTQTICSGASSSAVSFTSGVTGTTYSWTASATTGVSGFSASGTSTIPVQTISTTGTTQGIITYVITPTANGCSGTSVNYTILVNPRPTVTNTPLTQTLCSGASSSAVTLTSGVAGTTFGWTASATTGVSGFAASGTSTIPVQTISTTGSTRGTVTYVITPTANGCPGASVNYTILVDPKPSVPTVGTKTNPTCAASTGSVVLSGLPANGKIIQTGAVSAIYNITVADGGTKTINNLAGGNYNFAFSNGNCTSTTTANVSIIPPALVTWNGTNWSPNITPTIENRVEFRGNYSSTANLPSTENILNACSCYVENNAVVVFNSEHTLNVINEVIVESGSLTFENDASLVQHNEDANINSGNIIYKRKTKPVNRLDYTYWSSPVTNMTLGKLSPATFFDKYFSYNNAWKPETRATAMSKGQGYSVRAPQTILLTDPAKVFEATFTGVPHNGLFTLSLPGVDQAYLIGNPYPSAIDADVFLNLNSKLSVPAEQRVLEGTLYFWTHNSPPSTATPGDKKYNYTANDYATYNRTGGVSTAAKVDPLNYATGTNFSVPTGNIAAGQGFFAPTKAGGTVVFNNTMRISGGATGKDNSQFFKLSANSKTTTTVAKTEKNRIWLNLTNSEGAFKQTLVGYITGATNDYDGAFDGVTYDGNQYVDFYSVNNEMNLSIQGRALPFVKKDSVALGYKSTIKGDFQISIDQIDGSLATQNIFLEDKDLKVQHDLKKEAYTFTTEIGVFNNRFVLRYVDKNAIETIEPEIPADSNTAVLVSVQNGEITVNSPVKLIDKIIIYDVAGRKRYQNMKVANNSLIIKNILSSHQVLVVKITLENGKTVTNKIVY